MKFRMLGDLEAENAGRVVPLGSSERKVLAVLLLDADRVVAMDRLLAALWDREPPVTAAKRVRNTVWRLRCQLASAGLAGVVRTHGTGYRLAVGSECIDARVFESAVAQAERAASAGQRADAVRLLRSALGLWRGPALSGVEGLMIEAAAAAWNERRWAVTETCYDHELALGRHREITGELSALVAEHPLREAPVAQLMLALYRGGRRAEALTVYQRTRARLADELGLEPGEQLRQLHQEMLTGEAALTARADGKHEDVLSPGPVPTPRQLPGMSRYFTGRMNEIQELDSLLDGIARSGGGVVISAISGAAGIGKTALAVHWAHRVSRHFPDGQLYVNLRGFDPSGPPVAPGEALASMLVAIGVPPARIPATPDAQASLFRSQLTGRRMLVLLDNARDPAHARPLLPGSVGCLALVTSRNDLTGLVVTAGAVGLALGPLSLADGRDLLASHLGPQRVTAQSQAADELIERCAGLPLAISIAAARAAARPELSLATVASELTDASGRLDALDTGDPAASVRGAFSLSYQSLGEPAKRMFRLLAAAPGPDISLAAAASLAGVPRAQAYKLLRELTRGHLLTAHRPERFAFHDLLRSYAGECAASDDQDIAGHQALLRVLDHYLQTAHAAAVLLDPFRGRLRLPCPEPGVAAEEPERFSIAMSWFEAEHQVLLAAITRAGESGFDAHAWRLAWAIWPYFDRREYWHDLASAHRVALAAAQRLRDTAGQAHAHRCLGCAIGRTQPGQGDEARAHLRQAVDLFTQLGDHAELASAHLDLAGLAEHGHAREALEHAQRALGLYQDIGHPAGQARALNAVAWFHVLLGSHQRAIGYATQALGLYRGLHHRRGEVAASDTLGYAQYHLGMQAEAVASYRHAIALCRSMGERYMLAGTLMHLGDAQCTAGDPGAATSSWSEALAIFSELRQPAAEHARGRLASMSVPEAPP